MRILTLGFPLPGPRVDNHEFFAAPVFFDYDAIIVDPQAVSRGIEEVIDARRAATTRSGAPIVNGPGGPDGVSLADALRARRREAELLLARGGAIVCLLRPNVVHERVVEFSDCNRFGWVPAPAGVHYGEPFLCAGTGTEVGDVAADHAFGPLVQHLRGRLMYEAYFAEEALGCDRTVFARSAGGAAIGVDIAVGGGSVVFVPGLAREPTAEQRYALSQALQTCVRQALGQAAQGRPPAWVQEYVLPGLQERLEAHDAAQQGLSQAKGAAEAADAAVQGLERYRRLLWQEGKLGLEEPVREALGLLGFEMVPSDVDAPASIKLTEPGRTLSVALLEVESSEAAVGLEGHYRLRKRLEDAIAAGESRRGVLVINGHRRLAPAERPAQCEDSVRVAAETMRYCVATTEQLFHAVRASLEGDEATVQSFRERLLTTEGLLRED